MQEPDSGFTHVALPVRDLDRSIEFYGRYAALSVVHRRGDRERGQTRVAWLSDLKTGFVLVLAELEEIGHPLGPFAHLGIAVESLDELQRRCSMARANGCLREGPTDSGPPVGRWAFLDDPDGHTLELSFGQQVRWTVAQSQGSQGS